MPKYKLTTKQRKFTAIYAGNATQAAIKAGYSKKTAYSQGQRLLKNVEIIKAIKEREKQEIGPLIADRQARQRFWTEVIRDDTVEMNNRLKASELLGRSEADFTERKIVNSNYLDHLAEDMEEARKRVEDAEKNKNLGQ